MPELTPPRRSRWWIALAAAPAAVAMVVTVLAPGPSGHWVEHLQGAGFKSTQLLVIVVVAANLGRRRLHGVPAAALVLALIGIAFEVLGDAQVANAMWRTTGEPDTLPGAQAGHDNGGLGDLLVVLAGFGFALAGGITHRVRPSLAVLAGVMVIIPPPFLWPAAGILFVLLHALTTGRSLAGTDIGGRASVMSPAPPADRDPRGVRRGHDRSPARGPG
jgi:hypothetical protein